MARKRFTTEQIISKLREAEVRLAQGKTVVQACKQMGITEQTYYRWRKEYGGLKMDKAKRLKALEKENVRLCVQRRLACSAGDSPAGVRVSSPVAWIAGWRETNILKPIDKSPWGDRESSGRNESERRGGPESAKSRRPSRHPFGEGSMGSRRLNETAAPLRRGGSDGTMTRTCRATGEALLAPVRNRRSRVGPITGDTGKGTEGERVADGRVVCAGQRPDQEG